VTEKPTPIGRLALRDEGDRWTAYFADQDTMDDAIWLGSVLLKLVENPERRQQFIDLMTCWVADLLQPLCGERPTWNGPQTAPKHERRGG